MKGLAYFLSLWARNFMGNFKVLANLVKKMPLGTLLARIVSRAIALSPLMSLIKTIIDYTSRKTVGNPFNLTEHMTLEEKVQAKNKAIDNAFEKISEADLQKIIDRDLLAYEKRYIFSTMSQSTELILDLMRRNPPLQPYQTLKISYREALKEYMKNPRNTDKGFYNLVLKSIFVNLKNRHLLSAPMERAPLTTPSPFSPPTSTAIGSLTNGTEAPQLGWGLLRYQKSPSDERREVEGLAVFNIDLVDAQSELRRSEDLSFSPGAGVSRGT